MNTPHPFDEYIKAALRKAEYSVLPESGDCLGIIPGFHGVSATAADETSCEAELRRILEDWLAFRASHDLPIPAIDGTSVSREQVESYVRLRVKLESLEREVESLKAELGFSSSSTKSRVERFNEWYSSHFTLISSLVAILALLIAYFAYSVDPFEAYRETAAKKQGTNILTETSDYYRKLGDLMMSYTDYKNADEAYKKALEINPSNPEATRGLRINQFFLPDNLVTKGDDKQLPRKLSLLEDYPTLKTDPRVILFKGILFRNVAQQYGEAIRLFNDCANSHPDYLLCRIELGFTYTWPPAWNKDANKDIFNVDEAINSFKTALIKSPDNFLALYDLGYCYLLVEDFDNALENLKQADTQSDNFYTKVSLGDAYLFMGKIDAAISIYNDSLDRLGQPGITATTFLPVYAIYNFMPEQHGDRKTIKNAVVVSGVEQDKLIVNYLLSLAYAAQGKDHFKEAEDHFKTARQLDKSKAFSDFVVNRINSLLNTSKLCDDKNKSWNDTKKWLESHRNLIEKDHT